MAQVLISVRLSLGFFFFFQNYEKMWLTNWKTAGLEICATKQSY